MFQFNNKTVFIISPECWGQMKISKHHYAMELANRNCQVFFIEPPLLSAKGILVKNCDENANIKIVQYKPIARGKRFLPRVIYSILIRYQIKKLIKKIGVKPDVVWSFHGYVFENLQWFGAPVTIFFAADLFGNKKLPSEINSATVSIGVSDTIYKLIKEKTKTAFQINHGLQERFVEGGKKLLELLQQPTLKKNIQVGYSGNLRMEALDRQTMMKVISGNQNIQFIFWGTYSKEGSNLGAGFNDKEVDVFIDFLEKAPNVQLRGVVNSSQLQKEIMEVDFFWLCWNLNLSNIWDGSNSHKILEYLSSGKPVVSHYMSSYKDTDILYMLTSKSNENYERLFNDVVDKVKLGESEINIKKRLSFAVNNSYKQQLAFIENKINDVL
jgi:hypothetical protein